MGVARLRVRECERESVRGVGNVVISVLVISNLKSPEGARW